jgi:hypothetical protein
MSRDEISRYLAVGSTRSVVVDLSLSAEFSGQVRQVTIRAGNFVTVEFYPYGYDEGAPCFWGQYPDLDSLIADLEVYLARPLSEWENFTRSGSYPEADETAIDHATGGQDLTRAVAAGSVPLPSGVRYELRGGWWKDVADGKVPVG